MRLVHVGILMTSPFTDCLNLTIIYGDGTDVAAGEPDRDLARSRIFTGESLQIIMEFGV